MSSLRWAAGAECSGPRSAGPGNRLPGRKRRSSPFFSSFSRAHSAVCASCSGRLCRKSTGRHSSSKSFMRSLRAGNPLLLRGPGQPFHGSRSGTGEGIRRVSGRLLGGLVIGPAQFARRGPRSLCRQVPSFARASSRGMPVLRFRASIRRSFMVSLFRR